MNGPWSPLGGPEWMHVDSLLDEPLPECPVTVPAGNGRPQLVPYRYRGSDFSVPGHAEAVLAVVVLAPMPKRKPGPAPIDPGGPPVPFSAPAEWLHEYAMEGL